MIASYMDPNLRQLIEATHSDRRDIKSSSPIMIARWFKTLVERTSSTAPHMRQRAIILVDGHPVLFSSNGIQIGLADTESISAITTRDQLAFIKTELDLTVTQIAELLSVTRKTVYDWNDKSDPRPGITSKIDSLYRLLNSTNYSHLNLKKLKRFWNLPVSGQSFLSVLNGGSEQSELEDLLDRKLWELAPRMDQNPQEAHQVRGALRPSNESVMDGIVRDAEPH